MARGWRFTGGDSSISEEREREQRRYAREARRDGDEEMANILEADAATIRRTREDSERRRSQGR